MYSCLNSCLFYSDWFWVVFGEGVVQFYGQDSMSSCPFLGSNYSCYSYFRVLPILQVGKSEPIEGADFVVQSLHDLPHLVPHLWNIDGQKI